MSQTDNNKQRQNQINWILRLVLGWVLVAGVVVLFVFLAFYLMEKRHHRWHERMRCYANLHYLSLVLSMYCNDNDEKYPTANKWCDLLIKHENVEEELFVCLDAQKVGDKSRGHYAINPNCEPNSPNDVVLIFETKGGWNQFGGRELLTTDNHQGEICPILFKDFSVKYVKPEELGKLKWKDESDSERIKERIFNNQMISGTIQYIGVEGGFYGIVADNGEKYDPIKLPKEYQKDGLRVRFQVREKKKMMSFHMWGKIVEVVKIEKL